MASEDIAARGDASIKVRLLQLTLGIIVCCGQNVRKRVKQRQREEATQFFSLLFLHFLQTTKPVPPPVSSSAAVKKYSFWKRFLLQRQTLLSLKLNARMSAHAFLTRLGFWSVRHFG